LQKNNLERNFGYTPPKFNIDIENNQTFEAGDTVSKPFVFFGGIHVAFLGYEPIDFTIYQRLNQLLGILAADIGMVKSSIFCLYTMKSCIFFGAVKSNYLRVMLLVCVSKWFTSIDGWST